jgi:Uma2 family endonuclease
MTMPSTNEPPVRRYLRPPRAVAFPTEADVPESKRHLEIRTALYAILKLGFRERAMIGSDQFVYWDPTNPAECLAPDVFVRLGGPDQMFDSWKVWERGAPHVAVEIVSTFDASEASWTKKLRKYHRLGVSEVVRFDPDGGALRIWDYVEGDLVERVLAIGAPVECVPLGLFWVVARTPSSAAATDGAEGPCLRLARDANGTLLLLTAEEAAQAERTAALADRDAALEQVRALEEKLSHRP